MIYFEMSIGLISILMLLVLFFLFVFYLYFIVKLGILFIKDYIFSITLVSDHNEKIEMN